MEKTDNASPSSPGLSRTHRLTARGLLCLQLLACYPPLAEAAPAGKISENERLATLPSEPYILRPGETVVLVAGRHHITVDQLKTLNQFRTFSLPFNQLHAGDEIDVPRKEAVSSGGTALKETADPHTERQLASAMSRFTSIAASRQPGEVAASQITGEVASAAGNAAQDWLNQFGTARVRLNSDRKFKQLQGSELDMLLPFYDTKERLVFTQLGARRTDNRNTLNLGAGQRHFSGRWMMGYNAFFDHDFTGENTRAGVGFEYGRDYLKLAANGYFRLSGWKEAPDLEDYHARPANGFDLRADAYLPSYPQIGGKLLYEQYFGDEVGLTGADKRRKNARSLTAGVNWTPVPLITVGVGHRMGSGLNDTLLSAGLNYTFGQTWSQMLDSDDSGSRRTLAGARYDLIERRNDIVLEYRKDEVIRVSVTPGQLSGLSGHTRVLTANVTSKYALHHVSWDDSALRAQGGSVVPVREGQSAVLTLPHYQQGKNTWTVGVTATDAKGHTSARAEMQVTVTGSGKNDTTLDPASTFGSDTGGLPADGKSQTILSWSPVDENTGSPLAGLKDKIHITPDYSKLTGNGTNPQVGAVTERPPGTYHFPVTAGTKSGTLTLSPEVEGLGKLPQVKLQFEAQGTPIIEQLKLSGKPDVGEKLHAHYKFNANGGDAGDKSVFAWGRGAGNAKAENGKNVTTTGEVEPYPLTPEDAGEVIELAVLAINSSGVKGHPVRVNTAMSAEQGNRVVPHPEGGKIINPKAAPEVSNQKLTGIVEVGKELTYTYDFDAKKGDPTDKSEIIWGHTDGKKIISSGRPTHTIDRNDAGKIITVKVTAKNGRNVSGNTLETDTRPGSKGNQTTGAGDDGRIPNPPLKWEIINNGGRNKARKGKVIKVTISGLPANARMKMWSTEFDDRTGELFGVGGSLLINGSVDTAQWRLTSDNDGELTVELKEAPSGSGGLRYSKFYYAMEKGGDNILIPDLDVIFTRLTSPDSDKAQYWGHMPATLTAGGITFKRPLLKKERDLKGISETHNQENYSFGSWEEAQAVCGEGKVATLEQAKALQSNNALQKGWPNFMYTTIDQNTPGTHTRINLGTGATDEVSNAGKYHQALCIQ